MVWNVALTDQAERDLESDPMKTTKPKPIAMPAELPTRYAELVAVHMPRPIHDRVAYDNTVEVIDALAGHKLNADQEDYLELLSQLFETYEAAHLTPYPKVKGIDALKFLLAENQLTGDDLAKLLSVDRSTAYKILKGTRNLTTEHMRSLCERFSVGHELFIA